MGAWFKLANIEAVGIELNQLNSTSLAELYDVPVMDIFTFFLLYYILQNFKIYTYYTHI